MCSHLRKAVPGPCGVVRRQKQKIAGDEDGGARREEDSQQRERERDWAIESEGASDEYR